jgi:hypothetical protein
MKLLGVNRRGGEEGAAVSLLAASTVTKHDGAEFALDFVSNLSAEAASLVHDAVP